MKEPVLIKSNRYGITLYFHPDLPFDALLCAVADKLTGASAFFDHAQMAVQFKGRTFTTEEEQRMTDVIQKSAGIHILCLLETDPRTEQIHKRALEEALHPVPEADGQFYRGTLRGKQILESEKSIVIIGDIERGACVVSKGSVVATGTIYGSVAAGAAGDYTAVIAAPDMQPQRLRIGDREVKPVIGGSYSWAKLL